MYAIEIKGLQKTFPKGDFTLQLPSLQVEEGYITGFIGENGAGKTTTIKLILDMLFPDTGSVKVFGMDAQDESAKIKQEIGYVGGTNGYLQGASLWQICKMTAPFYPNWDAQRFDMLMEKFRLDSSLNKRYKALSDGQKKQFGLVMALSHHPRLLLLDEPTANLDPLVREEILQLIAEMMEEERMTVFFSTHITSDLDKVADYVILLDHGRMIFQKEKEGLVAGCRVVKGRNELLSGEVAEKFVYLNRSEFGFTGLTETPAQVYDLLGEEAVYERPNIEEIFLYYTKREREGKTWRQ